MKPLIGLSLVLIVGFAVLQKTNHIVGEQRLNQLRKDAKALLSASSEREKSEQVKRVLDSASPLLRQQGVRGGTAALFQAAVGPLSGDPVTVTAIPEPKILKLLDVHDLLTAARLMTYSHNLTPANTLVERLLQSPGVDRETVLRLAITLRYNMGHDADVIAHCDELTGLAPNDFRPHQVKATVFRNRSQWEHFVDAASQAISLAEQTDELQPIDLIEIIDGYLQLGDCVLAKRHMDQLGQLWPEQIDTIPTIQARLFVQEGQLARAEKFLDIALRRDPKDIEALVLKGTLLVGAERFQEAVEILDQTLKLSPTDERAHYQLGQAYSRLGDEKQAVVALQSHRILLDEKVRLYKLEETAGREPYNVQVRLELATAYARLGLAEQAEYWRTAARVAAQ